ncbi:MAG: response regulator [Pirellula sp.]|jgi:two-component SAPR family response regulator
MKTVLDVGNCNPDHAAISAMLKRQFQVEILRADQQSDMLKCLENQTVDLILINRKLDIDYSDGIEILRYLKSNSNYASIPVMLITNYPEHQQQAMELGAELGFGKLELNKPETHQKLAKFLGTSAA